MKSRITVLMTAEEVDLATKKQVDLPAPGVESRAGDDGAPQRSPLPASSIFLGGTGKSGMSIVCPGAHGAAAPRVGERRRPDITNNSNVRRRSSQQEFSRHRGAAAEVGVWRSTKPPGDCDPK